ncbi:MAG: hypothetical protein AAGA70_13930 [Pseudomonadota bacterium]
MRDLPVYRCDPLPGNHDADQPVGFADAPMAAPDAKLGDLDLGDAPALIVLAAHVVASLDAEALLPEPVLIASGKISGYLAQSAVSGGFVQPGLWLVPRQACDSHGARVLGELTGAPVLPVSIGIVYGNDRPKSAFELAFERARGALPVAKSDVAEAALFASIGADAQNGIWWVLGTFAGLLDREDCGTAWQRVAALSDGALADHHAAAAREVRDLRGMPVQAFNAAKSRLIRHCLPAYPGRRYWEKFDKECASLGDDGEQLATRYRAASAYLWDAA